jgi:hypothetical protein
MYYNLLTGYVVKTAKRRPAKRELEAAVADHLEIVARWVGEL